VCSCGLLGLCFTLEMSGWKVILCDVFVQLCCDYLRLVPEVLK
jgi:hypothetical protein